MTTQAPPLPPSCETLLVMPHGRDGVLHVLTAMIERRQSLGHVEAQQHTAAYWSVVSHAVVGAQCVRWLAAAIIHGAKLLGASVGTYADATVHVNVDHEYTLHRVTYAPIDHVCVWFDGEDEPIELSMHQARVVLLRLLHVLLDAADRQDVAYKVLRGEV